MSNIESEMTNTFNCVSSVPPEIMHTKEAVAAGVSSIAIYFSRQASQNIPASMSASQTARRYEIDSMKFTLSLH